MIGVCIATWAVRADGYCQVCLRCAQGTEICLYWSLLGILPSVFHERIEIAFNLSISTQHSIFHIHNLSTSHY